MTDSYTNWDEVPLLLTTDETAAILRVHTNTVKYLIHSGQLPAAKIGRAWRIPRESVRGIADCNSSVRALARDLVAALEPFGQLALPRNQAETTRAIPAQWIEHARAAMSRARDMGFEAPPTVEGS